MPCKPSRFLRDEQGAQVVEYALVIAVVSILLAIALDGLANPGRGGFRNLIRHVTNCLRGLNCT